MSSDRRKSSAKSGHGRRPAAPRAGGVPHASPLPEAAPVAPEAHRLLAARILLASLAVLVVARLLSIFAPGMWVWGFNHQRYIIAGLAYLPWLVSAILLIPSVAKLVAHGLAPLGDGFSRGAAWARAIAFALPAGLVLLVPDQVRLVGDFLLRQGAPGAPQPPGPLPAHALPLDVWLHVAWPTLAMDARVMSAIDASRALGALEAGGLGVAAAALPAAMRLGGAPALGAWSLGVFGAWLALYTGYGTAFAGMGIVVLVAAASVVRVGRDGHGLLPFGIALTAGLGLHRSALALLPAFAWAAWRAWGATADDAGERRRVRAALAAAAAALLVFGLPIARGLAAHDPAHLRPAWATTFTAAAWFTGPRLLDVTNVVLLLVPLALVAPLLFAALRPAGPRRAELAGLAWLAAPFALGLLVLFPQHGMFRGWDFFATTALALAALTAWLAGESLRGTRAAWLGVTLLFATLVPSSQWLAHHLDASRGVRRAEARVLLPPARQGPQNAPMWEYLGYRNLQLGRLNASAEAFRRAAFETRSRRILMQWAAVEIERGDLEQAQFAFRQIIERDSTDVEGWSGYRAVSWRMRDTLEERRAMAALERLTGRPVPAVPMPREARPVGP